LALVHYRFSIGQAIAGYGFSYIFAQTEKRLRGLFILAQQHGRALLSISSPAPGKPSSGFREETEGLRRNQVQTAAHASPVDVEIAVEMQNGRPVVAASLTRPRNG